MTKFETMMTILFSIHLFFELAMIGIVNKYFEDKSKGNNR